MIYGNRQQQCSDIIIVWRKGKKKHKIRKGAEICFAFSANN